MNTRKSGGHIRIAEYNKTHQPRFKKINEQWISKSFVMEEEDILTLENPEKHVLEKGGKIYMALYNDYLVGTCGYINMGNGVYEMIKMAVDEDYRGLKIGLKIAQYSIQKLKESGANKIVLFSNTKGSQTAIQLYRELGFKEIPLGKSEFTRADIKMELLL